MMFKLLSLAGIVAVASAGSHVETIDCMGAEVIQCGTGCSDCTVGQNDATCPDFAFCINSCTKFACCAEALLKQEKTCLAVAAVKEVVTDVKGETVDCTGAEVTKCGMDCSDCAVGQNDATCPDIAFCATSCTKFACCATAQAATCQFVPEVKDEVTKGELSECDQGKLLGLIFALPDKGALCTALLGEAMAEQTQKKDKSESEIAAIKPEDRKNAIAYECACYNSIPKEHPGLQPMTDANPDGDAMKCVLPGSTTEIDGRVRQCWAGNHDTQHANCNCMKNGCARTPGDEPKDEECEEECDCDEDAKSMKVYKDAKAAMDAAGKAATDAAAKAGVACFEAGAQKCAKDCAKCVPLGCGTTNINTPECPIACAACGTYASCAPDPAVPGSCPGTAPVPHAVSEKCKEECKPKDTKKDTKPTKKPFNLDVELKKLLVGLDVTSEDADKFVEDMKPYMDALKKEVMPDGTTTPDLTKLFDNTVFTAAVTGAGVDVDDAKAAAASYEYDDGSDSAAAISAAAAAVAASIVAALF